MKGSPLHVLNLMVMERRKGGRVERRVKMGMSNTLAAQCVWKHREMRVEKCTRAELQRAFGGF